MVVPHSFSPWVNLPFFVGEAFLLTACTWHTSRCYTSAKSYILPTKNQRTLFGSLSHLNQHELVTPWHQCTTNSAILQDFGNNTGFCISFASADLWILPLTYNIPSSSMNGSNFGKLLHALSILLLPKRLILLQSVFSGQIWLFPSPPSIFLPSLMVHYNAVLCDSILQWTCSL